MNRPLNRDVAIDALRYQGWLGYFAGYRNVTQLKIELWLQQFSAADRGLGARLLDSVLFIGDEHVRNRLAGLLQTIPGWNSTAAKRQGRWVFVPFSGSVGESGDTMVHVFRQATGMTNRRFNALFLHRSELVAAKLTPDDTVVLIDDFAGTGKQATDSWNEVFAELLSGGPRIFLMLVAATDTALKRISDDTDMEPVCGTRLRSAVCDVFSPGCQHFNADEKNAILTYCTRADAARPRGWGNCGLLVVLSHRCPNNSVPILHAHHANWQGLFPRH